MAKEKYMDPKKYSKSGMSKNWQNALGVIGSSLGSISGNDIPKEDKAVREGLRSTIAQFGPWGAAISAATGVVDAIGEWTDTNLDHIDQNAAKRAGIEFGAGFNKVMNMLPGNSMLWGIFGGETGTAHMSTDATLSASSYGGAIQKMMDAQQLGNKRMLFQKNKANQFIEDANKTNDLLTDMSRKNMRRSFNYAGQLLGTNYAIDNQGYTPGLVFFNKKGGTIPELEEVRSIIQSLKSNSKEISEDPQKFQLGGKMNMIVTGALHARKHDLEELNPNLEGEITKKGIPVVVMNEGGEVQSQQAEVESGEIIMNFDTTKTIEDYYNEYNSTDSKTEKNKIALECGKYLVNELLKNTDDPDKLIKKTNG